MWALDVLACASGLVLLAVASDHLVRGASVVAAHWGVPLLVVGVVVIGAGTSVPELLVSVLAALRGASDVGIGNVVGSNIANLTFVLGTAAVVAPVAVRSAILRREVPLTMGAGLVFALALLDGLSRVEGVVLLVLLALAYVLLLRWSPRDVAPGKQEVQPPGEEPPGEEPLVAEVAGMVQRVPPAGVRRDVARTALGLAGTVVGAQLLVSGALGVAATAGLSGGGVGLTIVAAGTSLPEVVSAVQAARRGAGELVVGNILGSNIVNSLGVGGAVAVLAPGPVTGSGLAVGAVAMCAVSVLSLALMRRRFQVDRWEGGLLVIGYLALVPVLALA